MSVIKSEEVRKYQAHIVVRQERLTLSDGHKYRSQARDIHILVTIVRQWYRDGARVGVRDAILTTHIRGAGMFLDTATKLIDHFEHHAIVDWVESGYSYHIHDIRDVGTGMHFHPMDYP